LLSPAANDNPELFQHYFNANHLGSGSLITDDNGNTYQTLAYAPHGELLVNEINGNYDEPYKFSGFLRDQESGLDYAHARYREPDKTIFYSTDPMWFKYPHITPYNYAGNNPIMVIDLDGNAYGDPPMLNNACLVSNWFKNIQKNINIPSIIPKDKFVPWTFARDCYENSKEQLRVAGYNMTDKTYQIYTERGGVNKNNVKLAVDYLNSALEAGVPVMVGVDYRAGAPEGNYDKTTDHFLVITGCGSDSKGTYYTYYDNAVSDPNKGTDETKNRFYYNENEGILSDDKYRGYDVTAKVSRVIESQKINKSSSNSSNSQQQSNSAE